MEEEKSRSNIKRNLTLIGAIISNLLLGNSLSWLYTVYSYHSYISEKIPNLNEIYNMIFISLTITCHYISNFIINLFDSHKNIRIYLFISFSLMTISQAILLYIPNIILICLGFAIYGIGTGISIYPLIKNITLHFFEKDSNSSSKIKFLLKSCYYLSPLIFHFYNKFMIRKNNVDSFLFFNIILYMGLGILSIILSFDYVRECLVEETDEKKKDQLIYEFLEDQSIESRSRQSESSASGSQRRVSTFSTSSRASNRTDLNKMVGQKNNSMKNFKFEQKLQKIFFVINSFNFYLIVLFFTIMMLESFYIIYDLEMDLLQYFICFLSILRIILPKIIVKLSFKQVGFIIIVIQILLCLYSKYGEKVHNQELLMTFGISLNYSILTIILTPLSNQLYGNEINLVMESIIKAICNLSCWIKVLCVYLYHNNFSFDITIIPLILSIPILMTVDVSPFCYNVSKSSVFHFSDEDEQEIELQSVTRKTEDFEDVFDNDVKSDAEN